MARVSALLVLGLLSTSLASTVQARSCLTSHQADDIVARWTSLAINISSSVADCTVTDDFEFFSDSQNFLEGTPVGRRVSHLGFLRIGILFCNSVLISYHSRSLRPQSPPYLNY